MRSIQINLDFARDLKDPPLIFSVNYFLKDKDGRFLNEKTDKRVWYKWMELRAHKEVGAIDTPTGRIPKYKDLKRLFKEVLKKDYRKEDYNKQFMVRIPENLTKIKRIENIYKNKVKGTPKTLFEILGAQRKRLLECREKYGDHITPDKLLEK